jgi:hypothetical protein
MGDRFLVEYGDASVPLFVKAIMRFAWAVRILDRLPDMPMEEALKKANDLRLSLHEITQSQGAVTVTTTLPLA